MEKGSHVHMDDYIFISQANSFVQILFRAARKIKKKTRFAQTTYYAALMFIVFFRIKAKNRTCCYFKYKNLCFSYCDKSKCKKREEQM